MADVVMVLIPVPPEAARVLADGTKLHAVGRLVSDMLRPSSPEGDPLAALIAEVKAEARADRLTDEVIKTELAAYNAEGRV